MTRDTIIKKVQALNLPEDQFVIIGSGTLAVLGIREAEDIDVSVTQELFDILSKQGDWRVEGDLLKKENIELKSGIWNKEYPVSTDQLIKSSLIIDGVRFINLQELLRFKDAMGREKDMRDITLIHEYLRST